MQDSGIGRFEASTSFTTPTTTISTRSDPVLPEAGRMHYQTGLNMRVPVPGQKQDQVEREAWYPGANHEELRASSSSPSTLKPSETATHGVPVS